MEVKDALINKGRAAQNWLCNKSWDFILAIGDDRTDEDLFDILPCEAFSIKVGFGSSKARCNIFSQKDVLTLLSSLIESDLKIKIN